MKLQTESEIKSFIEEVKKKSKKVKAYPIEDDELKFITHNFMDYLKRKKEKIKEVKVLEIGGGIGSFAFRFFLELIQEGLTVNYTAIEKCGNKVELFKRNLEQFKRIIEKDNSSLLRPLKTIVLEGDAIEILKNLVKTKKKYDFILIDANKKRYKEYFLLSLKLSDFIVIDDVFFKAKNKRTKSIENYLVEFMNYLENLRKKNYLQIKYLRKGNGLVIIGKDN